MKEFNFKDAKVKMKLAGHVFEVDMGDRTLHEQFTSFSQRALEYSKALQTSEDAAETLEEATNFMLESIDGMLGRGASETIFEGRTIDLADATDVVNYILQCLNQAREKRLERYHKVSAEAGK